MILYHGRGAFFLLAGLIAVGCSVQPHPESGKVLDEARQAGRDRASFPQACLPNCAMASMPSRTATAHGCVLPGQVPTSRRTSTTSVS